MNFVEPIRDRKKIAQIKNLLRGQNRFRDLLLFVVGINTALRITDLLKLQVGYFVDERGDRSEGSGSRSRKGESAMRSLLIIVYGKRWMNI